MKRLGYTEFVAQGGDWGGIITDMMATQRHSELIGIHTNMAGLIPDDIDKLARAGAPTHPVSRLTNDSHMTGWSSYMVRASATSIRWNHARRRFMGLLIPPSVLPPTFSMTMHVV